jgi:hypothetical protein
MNRSLLFVLLLATSVALAEDAPKAKQPRKAAAPQEEKKQEEKKEEAQAQAGAQEEPKSKEDANLGMSILGNQETPKALVIVPWKRSEVGSALDISTMLDDSRSPIDKEVFMRMLSYYEIRSGTTHQVGAAAAGRETAPAAKKVAQPANAAHRRKS